MVKSEKGTLYIEGSETEIYADLATLLHGVRELWKEDFGEEKAKQFILTIVEDSLKSEEQLIEENGGSEDGE